MPLYNFTYEIDGRPASATVYAANRKEAQDRLERLYQIIIFTNLPIESAHDDPDAEEDNLYPTHEPGPATRPYAPIELHDPEANPF